MLAHATLLQAGGAGPGSGRLWNCGGCGRAASGYDQDCWSSPQAGTAEYGGRAGVLVLAGQSALRRKIVLSSVSYMPSATGVAGVATRPVKVDRVSVCRTGRVVQTEQIFPGPFTATSSCRVADVVGAAGGHVVTVAPLLLAVALHLVVGCRSLRSLEQEWRDKQAFLPQPDVLLLAMGTQVAYRAPPPHSAAAAAPPPPVWGRATTVAAAAGL
jgi:hypothetical protein